MPDERQGWLPSDGETGRIPKHHSPLAGYRRRYEPGLVKHQGHPPGVNTGWLGPDAVWELSGRGRHAGLRPSDLPPAAPGPGSPGGRALGRRDVGAASVGIGTRTIWRLSPRPPRRYLLAVSARETEHQEHPGQPSPPTGTRPTAPAPPCSHPEGVALDPGTVLLGGHRVQRHRTLAAEVPRARQGQQRLRPSWRHCRAPPRSPRLSHSQVW